VSGWHTYRLLHIIPPSKKFYQSKKEIIEIWQERGGRKVVMRYRLVSWDIKTPLLCSQKLILLLC
jgi:hypothetical protein